MKDTPSGKAATCNYTLECSSSTFVKWMKWQCQRSQIRPLQARANMSKGAKIDVAAIEEQRMLAEEFIAEQAGGAAVLAHGFCNKKTKLQQWLMKK